MGISHRIRILDSVPWILFSCIRCLTKHCPCTWHCQQDFLDETLPRDTEQRLFCEFALRWGESGLQAMHLCVNHLPDNLKRPFFHCIMCSFRPSASAVCPWGSVPMQEYLRKLLAHHQCCVFKLNGCIGDKFRCVPTDSPQQDWQVYLPPLHVSEYFEDTFNQETTLFKKLAPVLGMVHMWVEIRVSCIGTMWGTKGGIKQCIHRWDICQDGARTRASVGRNVVL